MKRNTKKILICWTALVCIVVLVVILGIIYLLYNILYYCTAYHSTNQKTLIMFLEKNYNVNFPQSMTDIQASELYTGIDASSYFVLKFRADSIQTNDFLRQLNGDPNWLVPYTPEYINNIGKYPAWFRSPIKIGQKGHITSKSNTGIMMDVYIDTDNEDYFVVYMEGVYKM